ELEIADLDRVPSANRTDHARRGIRVPAAIDGDPGPIEIDAVERGGEAVRVALASLLAVREDVEARALLVADREQGRVVLRLLQQLGRNPPELLRADPRRKPARQPGAVDQPLGLRVGTHQGRGQEHRSNVAATGYGVAVTPRILHDLRAIPAALDELGAK